jgi:hypothetical protein
MFQILDVSSCEEVITKEASEENIADHTTPECPESVCLHSPVAACQILVVLSKEAVATKAPSEEN